jgi:hypothetical protein
MDIRYPPNVLKNFLECFTNSNLASLKYIIQKFQSILCFQFIIVFKIKMSMSDNYLRLAIPHEIFINCNRFFNPNVEFIIFQMDDPKADLSHSWIKNSLGNP